MALLLTSVFGVAGCGSDDDVQVESRAKNAAPEASAVSDAPSEADCEFLDSVELDPLDDLRRDLRLVLRDRCDAASKSGTDSPEGDDFDEG